MARCPNCSYILVLLKNRPKYKCAKCGRLFPQKEAENREFKTWNQKQRENDRENLKVETRLKKEEKLKKREERKRQLLERKNKPKLTEEEKLRRRRKYDKRRYEQHKLQKRLRRQNNKEHTRQETRIQYWRRQQRLLALQQLENEQYRAYNPQISPSVSTMSLAQLLFLQA